MSMKKRKMTLLSIATFIIFIISGIGSFNNVAIVNAMEERQEENNIVNIPDKNLKQYLKKELGIGDRELTVKDMEMVEIISPNDIEISSLEGIQYCTNLGMLHIYKGTLSDLSPISSLEKIWDLRIENCNVTDLTPISSLSSLEDINIGYCDIKDLSPIVSLEKLSSVILKGYKKSLSQISSIKKLTNIELEDCNIEDLNFLSSSNKLNSIILSNCNVSDLKPISNLNKLREINLSNCKVRDLTPLENLSSLVEVYCKNLDLINYECLGNMTNLRQLKLDNCNLINMLFVKKLTELNQLDLSNNYIRKVEGVDKLSNLNILSLNNNEIEDLAPLKNIPKYTKTEYGNDLGLIYVYDNLVGNSTDKNSNDVIEDLNKNGYEVEIDEYQSKEVMHLMKVNGKRYISGETYNLSSDNELNLEFTKDIQPVEDSSYINFYDNNYKNVTDYSVNQNKNILKVKLTKKIGTDAEYHLSMSDYNIQGLSMASIIVTGYNDSSKDEAINVPGDVNNDGIVDMKDISILANNYNKVKSQSSDWNDDIDCVKDGIIDIYDITFISSKLQ